MSTARVPKLVDEAVEVAEELAANAEDLQDRLNAVEDTFMQSALGKIRISDHEWNRRGNIIEDIRDRLKKAKVHLDVASKEVRKLYE